MQVRKRNGAFESVDLSKIELSLKRYCGDLPNIDVYRIASKTVGGLVDGVSTLELDLLSVRTAKDLIIDDPVYAKVAARILANVIQKEVAGLDIQSFSQSIELGFQEGLISNETHALVLANKRKLNAAIKHERDWNMEFHGLQTVYDRYVLKHPTQLRPDGGGKRQRAVIETPQYFFMRVACGLANDAIEAIEMYNLLSSLEYMCSTPTLFNSGTTHSQMSSCYLNDSPLDSLDSIYKSYSDIALLSKFAGGIGVSLSRIRGRDALIRGTNGKSNGIVPWAHTLSASVGSTNQGGRRKGAAAIYLEPHHPDIMQFLELKDNSGEREQRAYNLNLANWVSDLFMKRVKQDAMWSLFDSTVAPELVDLYGNAYEKRYIELEAEKKFTEQMPARKVYARMMRTLAETGNGWMTFKDTCNRRGNQVNDEAGTMIHLSNLCVSPETLLLTDQGHLRIDSLKGLTVNAWNGKTFSPVMVQQTGTMEKLIQVRFGEVTLDCTPYHKFYIEMSDTASRSRIVETRACELWEGAKIAKFELPIINGDTDFPHAYTHGFFCGDGTYGSSDQPVVHLYGEKKLLVDYLAIKSGSGLEAASGRLNFVLVDDLPTKFTVPTVKHTIASRLQWLSGLTDADGSSHQKGSYGAQIRISSVVLSFLHDVRLMLQTLGVHAKIELLHDATVTQFRANEKAYQSQKVYSLYISGFDVSHLLSLGLDCHRLVIAPTVRDSRRFIRVTKIQDLHRTDDTYCVSEQQRHMVVFNGILTGQCTEILEVTSSGKQQKISREDMSHLSSADMIKQAVEITGFDRAKDQFEAVTGSEIAVCNLGSINIARGYIKNGKLDKDKLRRNVSIAIKFLDRVINRNFYPVPSSESSNMRWRPVGLGLMGLADFFMQLRIPFDSEQAIKLSAEIQEEIYYHALKTSCDLAKELGPHRDFSLTRAAKGDLQFDLAGVTPLDPARWDVLKAEIKEHGLRNSLTIAIAPTACQAGTNVIRTELGPKSLYAILEENEISYRDIEGNDEPLWLTLKPFKVPTLQGLKVCDRIWFNGSKATYEITYEDGSVYEYTGNHRLYVNHHESVKWAEVRYLSAGFDEVVTHVPGDDCQTKAIKSIKKMPIKPTWDIEVEDAHHYLMSNGTVSHNTISHICGVDECVEPIKSNLLKRETLSGEFISVNKYLVEDLRRLGRWNAETTAQLKIDEGSIANIAGLPPELYANYKTVWEMSMKSLISHAVARGAYIDQSHSLNMFIDLNKYPEDKRIGVLSSLYMHAWESGLKTTYYFRSRSATRIQQTTVQAVRTPLAIMAPEDAEVCESCT